MKRPSRSEVIRDPSLHPSYTLDVPPPELPEYVFPPSSRPCVVCVCVRAIQPSHYVGYRFVCDGDAQRHEADPSGGGQVEGGQRQEEEKGGEEAQEEEEAR